MSKKKILTVQEVLEKINSGKSKRFSKERFKELTLAMANDVELASKLAVVKKDELAEIQDLLITKEFRKFLRKVVEKAGVDASDSEIVMSSNFVIDDVDGLYEFMSEVIYTYMDTGSTFEFLPKEDFKGSIFLKDKEESVVTKEATAPQTGEKLGTFKTTKKKHKVIGAKSKCPKYLSSRVKID